MHVRFIDDVLYIIDPIEIHTVMYCIIMIQQEVQNDIKYIMIIILQSNMTQYKTKKRIILEEYKMTY